MAIDGKTPLSNNTNENNKKKSSNKKNSSKKRKKTKFSVMSRLIVLFLLVFTSSLLFFKLYFGDNSSPVFQQKEEVQSEEINDETDLAKVDLLDSGVIYDNIFLNDIAVGGLTITEAKKLLDEKLIGALNDKEIIYEYDGAQHKLNYSSLSIGYDIDKALEEAYNFGRETDKKTRNDNKKYLKSSPKNITMLMAYDENAINEFLIALASKIDVAMREPTLKREGVNFVFGEGQNGYKLNIEKALTESKELVSLEKTDTIFLKVDEVVPTIPMEDMKKATSLLGTYKTSLKGSTADRLQNVTNAALKINNTVLYPEEIFSTNVAFGDMTIDNGYRPGATIVNGKFENSIGGGVCQISSTLYVASLMSEIEIAERQNHSLKVGYMDYAFDATLAGTYIDLKLKNNTKYPITIVSYVEKSEAIVNIYGYNDKPANRKIDYKNKFISSTQPPESIKTDDPTLPIGETKEIVKSRVGHKYQLYKYVYVDDKLVSEDLVNTSVYKATQGEYLIGTGPAVIDPNAIETTPVEGTPAEVTPPAINEPQGETATTENATTEPEITEPTTEAVEEVGNFNDNIEDPDTLDTSSDGFVAP